MPNEYGAVWAPETFWTLSEERPILSVPGIEPRFLGFPARNELNTATELPQNLFQYGTLLQLQCTAQLYVSF